MATYHEPMSSRDGTMRGTLGGSQPRVVIVDLEPGNENDWIDLGDNVVVPADPAILVQLYYLPKNTPHPWRPDCLSRDYTVTADQNVRGRFIVRVDHYNPAASGPVYGHWRWSGSFVTITKQIFEEPVRQTQTTKRGGTLSPLATTEPRIIGRREWVPVTPIAGQTEPRYRTTQYDSVTGAPKTIYLASAGGDEHPLRTPTGMTVEMPALSKTGEIRVKNWTDAMTNQLSYYAYAINNTVFYSANPHHVKFAGCTWRPVADLVTGQIQPGVSYDVTVTFLFSAIPWTPHEEVGVYPADRGWSLVYDHSPPGGGGPIKVRDEFYGQHEMDLNTALAIIER